MFVGNVLHGLCRAEQSSFAPCMRVERCPDHSSVHNPTGLPTGAWSG